MCKSLCGLASTLYRDNSLKKLKIRYCIIWRCLHLMFSTTNVLDIWNEQGFERMSSYEQYPKRNLASGCHLLKKIDQTSWRTTRRNYKHVPQIVCISSGFRGCTFLYGNLSNPKSSEDTLIYLYVIWNMLKSADPHESILTLVICHVRYHDGVTLYFSVQFPSVAPKKTGNWYFSYMSADFRFLK